MALPRLSHEDLFSPPDGVTNAAHRSALCCRTFRSHQQGETVAMSSSLTVERNISIPMRDGVRLSADLYRPAQSGQLPVLLQRTPYNKSGPNGVSQAFAMRAAEAGFAVVVQDVRGRYNSGGDFTAFDQEAIMEAATRFMDKVGAATEAA